MATIETFKVNKGLKYLVKARKDGYYDHAQVFGGTEEDTSVSVPAMTPYDGLSMAQVNNYKCADTVDFSNTILPWKWDYEKYLSTSKFALMPLGDYKYPIYEPNGIITGTLTNNDNAISGFSKSNYITLAEPFNPANNPWEVRMKITTGSDFSITAAPVIFSSCPDNKYGINLNFYHNDNYKQFNLYCSSDGSSWLFDLWGTHEVQLNTKYWIKFGWTGIEYYLDYSTDGITYIRDITFESNAPIYNQLSKTVIGINSLLTNPFNGSIDLNECYAKIDNEIVWNGVVKDTTNNITFVGSPTFNAKTMVVSNFSTSNYITTPVFNPANNPWEVKMKFTTGSDDMSETSYKIFGSAIGNSTATRYGISLLIYKANFDFGISINGSTWAYDVFGTYALQTNTTYWVRFGWTGTEYYLDYSTDGNVYNRDITIQDSTPVYNTLGFTTVGGGYGSNQWIAFNGTIDLSETELLINGETFYKPEVTYVTNTIQGCLYNYTDTGQATTLNCFTVNGDERVILTPDTSYNNERFLGTVEIAEHDVYDYVDGEWRKK